MAKEAITMPQLGESVTEGTINSWLVEVGDQVNKYDPIADIMTDKVNAEIPSSYTGIIKEIIVGPDVTVKVGEVICYIETDEETSVKIEEETVIAEQEVRVKEDTSMKNRYSPAVFKMAAENNIDLNQVTGTGNRGRITRKDIELIIATGETPRAKEQTSIPKDLKQQKQVASTKTAHGDIEIPITGVRKVIAENMVRSKTEIPHAWMTVEVDVTDLVSYRNSFKDQFQQTEGFNLTFFPFFIKAVAQSLREYPQLNSTWAGDKIIQRKDVNVSIAVADENNLFVPVIKQADGKSIKGIAEDIYNLAMKARSNKLTANDMQGGTFTVNNTGSFGSVSSMGVINYPQAAILQVETIVKRPVIIDDMFAARDIVNLSLSLDHRILDGLICGRFLARVKELLENMNKETINIY